MILLYCGLSSQPGGSEKFGESAVLVVGSVAFREDDVGGSGEDDCCSFCSSRRLLGVVDSSRMEGRLEGL